MRDLSPEFVAELEANMKAIAERLDAEAAQEARCAAYWAKRWARPTWRDRVREIVVTLLAWAGIRLGAGH